MRTLVMKFGGAAVANTGRFKRIAEIIIRRKKEYDQIAVVVSAMGGATDRLIALAKKINTSPPQREYDMLVTTGERVSISLLAMELCKYAEAISYTGSQSGIITCSQHAGARIIEVRPTRIQKSLEKGKIVIVAGFQGVSREGEITTLGRGGGDTTAVALGVALNAEKVEFYKDVGGIFTEDPKKVPHASIYSKMNYREALAIVAKGAKVLHSRSLELAEKNGMILHIGSFRDRKWPERGGGTLISDASIDRTVRGVYE